MKKLACCCLTIFFAFLGCKQGGSSGQDGFYYSGVDARKIAVSDDEVACDPKSKEEDQCILIPLNSDDCFGCFDEKGSGVMAVNLKTAADKFKENGEKCEKEFKAAHDSGKKPRLASHETCKYNWAKCSEKGVCMPVTLRQEEFQKKMEMVKKALEQKDTAPISGKKR